MCIKDDLRLEHTIGGNSKKAYARTRRGFVDKQSLVQESNYLCVKEMFNDSSQSTPYCEQWWSARGLSALKLGIQGRNERESLMCHSDGATKNKKMRVHEGYLEQGKKVHIGYALNEAWRTWKVPWTRQESAHWLCLERGVKNLEGALNEATIRRWPWMLKEWCSFEHI